MANGKLLATVNTEKGVHVHMNHAELFIFPGTRSPQFGSPSRASLRTTPVLHFAVNYQPRSRERHIDWDHVLGMVVLLGGSALAWTSLGTALTHLVR
jgi:hypothetical protein